MTTCLFCMSWRLSLPACLFALNADHYRQPNTASRRGDGGAYQADGHCTIAIRGIRGAGLADHVERADRPGVAINRDDRNDAIAAGIPLDGINRPVLGLLPGWKDGSVDLLSGKMEFPLQCPKDGKKAVSMLIAGDARMRIGYSCVCLNGISVSVLSCFERCSSATRATSTPFGRRPAGPSSGFPSEGQ